MSGIAGVVLHPGAFGSRPLGAPDLDGMMRAADLPAAMRDRAWVEPALVIRASDGSVHPEYVAVKLSIGFPP